MATTIIGKIGTVLKHAWSATDATYNRLDEVTYQGSTYRVILPTGFVPVGTLPTNATYFEVSAQGVDTSNVPSKSIVDAENRSSNIAITGVVEIDVTGVFLTKTNTQLSSTSARISKTFAVKEGNPILYTGRYGLTAVAVLFFNDAGDIIGFWENASQITVTDQEIPIPVGATIAKASSLTTSLGIKLKNSLILVNTADILKTEQKARSLKLDTKGLVEVENTGFYLTKTNTQTASTGAVITKIYALEAGQTVIYSGRYGQLSAAAVFFNDAGGIVGFVETATVVNVTNLEILLPAGTTSGKFSSLNSTLSLKIKESLVTENAVKILENKADVVDLQSKLKSKTPFSTTGSTGPSTTSSTAYLLIGNRNFLTQNVFIIDLALMVRAVPVGGNFSVRMYATNSSNVITRVYDEVDFTGVVANTIITIPVNANFYIGERYYLAVPIGVVVSYGTVSTGFNLKLTSTNTIELAAGYSVTSTQDFVTGSPMAVNGYVIGDDYQDLGLFATRAEVNLNRLYGKKIVGDGDSMMRGHTLTVEQSWLNRMGLRNGMTVQNIAVNGKRLTNTGGSGTPLVLSYVDLDNDADIVAIFIGTNDGASGITMGADDSTLDTEFKGALNIVCSGLITKFPNKPIVFITPYLKNVNMPPYVTAIETICAKYSIPVFNNIKNGGICFTNSAQATALTLGDGTHLNDAGLEYASYKYESFLKAL